MIQLIFNSYITYILYSPIKDIIYSIYPDLYSFYLYSLNPGSWGIKEYQGPGLGPARREARFHWNSRRLYPEDQAFQRSMQ